MAECRTAGSAHAHPGRVVAMVDHLVEKVETACAGNQPRLALDTLLRLLRRSRHNSAARRYALCQLADLHLALGDLRRALAAIRWGLRLFPRHDYLHYLLGYAHSRRERWKPAGRALARACLLNPQNSEYHRALGWCLYQRGWHRAGEEALRRAVSLAPTHAWALADLAVCLLREWRVEEALKYARAAARLRPSEPQILEVLRTASRLASRPGHRAGLQHTEE